MNGVFDDDFDVGATWRHEPRMPVNGGILFVKKEKIERAISFFKTMQRMTEQAILQKEKRRWFGQSDQVRNTKNN
eukprot:3684676-Pyramimonas_sp.AAC.2